MPWTVCCDSICTVVKVALRLLKLHKVAVCKLDLWGGGLYSVSLWVRPWTMDHGLLAIFNLRPSYVHHIHALYEWRLLPSNSTHEPHIWLGECYASVTQKTEIVKAWLTQRFLLLLTQEKLLCLCVDVSLLETMNNGQHGKHPPPQLKPLIQTKWLLAP